jgi:transcription initiation factor TFIID subunit 5
VPFSQSDLPVSYPQINYNRLPNNININNIPHLGPHQLPSICLFTLKHSKQIINCVTLSNDCRLLAIGFQSSQILVCSLNSNHKLYSMKSTKDLRHIITNSTQENILHTTSCIETPSERLLTGHQAAIFALAFEPNKQIYLLSGSQDCTIRLWHLSTWTCLVVYKMHYQPILDSKFNI